MPIENLSQIFEEKLRPQMIELEKERLKLVRIIYFLSGSILILIISGFLHSEKELSGGIFTLISAIISAVATIILGVVTYIGHVKYRKEFKKSIVRKLLEELHPDWQYFPDKHISEKNFVRSGLFKKSNYHFKGDDLIYGMVDKTKFCFSELEVEDQRGTGDDRNTVTLFKGIFFFAEFNKHIKSKTYVATDHVESLFGSLAKTFQKLSSKGSLVSLENQEFEKYFVVHSTDQQEARYILTPAIMESMVNLRRKYDRKIQFSFVGDRVYCSLSFKENLFEPKVFSTVLNFSDIQFMVDLFNISKTIISELNLNTRIWTKD